MMMWGSRTGSGRASVSTAPSSTQQLAAQRKVQEIYQSSPENQCCADCTARLSDSVWASTTVGAFLCILCAGAHRTLGVQLSRVKSLHLDAWVDDDVPAMKGGNKRVHEVYGKYLDKWIAGVDATYALHPKSETSVRERYIRAKYEDMKFTKAPTAAAIALAAASSNVRVITEEKGSDSPELPEDSVASGPVSLLSSLLPSPPITSTTTTTPIAPPLLTVTAPIPSPSTRTSSMTIPPRPHENQQQRSPVHKPNDANNQEKRKNVVELTKRFLNYFIVLGRGTLVPNQQLEKTKGPTDIQFVPTILDSYPEAYEDTPFPSHLAEFAFPEGFALSQTYLAPTFFSFVLTNVNGIKIYACALKFYEELHPLEVVSLLAPYYHQTQRTTGTGTNTSHRRRTDPIVLHSVDNCTGNNQSAELPQWVQDLSGNMSNSPGPVFCPKCIIVTSYYPYFSAFRPFLQQIYRITLSDAPMPIERYITNFVTEIPLPPPGQIQVQLTLPDRNLIISRPPRNEFPMVDFSFRPLFQALDITNVLQLFTCVVLEFKIVLCSKHIALLTPVAETVLALLLPFSWQGAYIPVLPSSLLDVIDAPVPFLVGTHSDCMKQAVGQSSGVVFVDLDHNRIIPAVDESGKTIPIPKLPERESAKLRAKLFEYANNFDPFAAGLNKIDLAFPQDEHLDPIGNFASERGHTVPLAKTIVETSVVESSTSSIYSMGKIMRGRKLSSAAGAVVGTTTNIPTSMSSSSTISSASSPAGSSTRNGAPLSPNRQGFASSFHFTCTSAPPVLDGIGGLTDSKYNDTENFSTKGIRKAFLRFFVTLLKKYAAYLNMAAVQGKATDSLFDTELFLRDNCDASSKAFVAQLISTQMFDRFVEDRVFNPHLPEVLFFDQSINQKLNRSLTLGKKKYDCSFLDDKSDEIRETFIAPPPSNIGLPDDGTVYKYKSFPKLKKSLFGTIRKPRVLFTSREQQRNISQVDFHQRIFTMSRCMKGNTASWEATRRLILRLQTQFRMYSARKKYQDIRKAATVLQQWARARIKGKVDRDHFLQLRRAAIKIQSVVRMRATLLCYQAKCQAIRKLQFVARGYIQRARFLRARRGIHRLQAQWRSSFHKRTYKNLKYQIIRVQSRIRGYLSRNNTMRWKNDMFESFRRKIFDLWEQCDVPLLHRSKFWLTFNRPDFFNLGIYLEEERRLQAYFREAHTDAYEYQTQTLLINRTTNKPVVNHKMGLKSALRSLVVKHVVAPDNDKEEERKVISDVAGARIEKERHQLYEALKRQTSATVRTAFYRQFNMPIDSKKKKRRLAQLVWTNYSEAGTSAEVVVTISCSSDRYHPLPAQIDRHKQLRIREDLTFTVNAALKSIRYASPESSASLQPNDRELIELQHQVRMLAAQNHRLTGELMTCQREMSRLQMELQLQQQPQLRKITSERSVTGPS